MKRFLRKVRLGGRDYEIDSEDVRRLGSRLQPKPLDKYWVKIGEQKFPPKQLVAELLEIPVASFTTMDAQRVLAAIGFEIRSDDGNHPYVKTESEVLVEEYMSLHGLSDFDFEPQLLGTTRRPDFLVRTSEGTILLEVKEFTSTAKDFASSFGYYDPYGPIREKIEAGRKKFKDLDKYCCCLVLHNQEKPHVSLGSLFIMGAMLGDLGFSFPVNTAGQGDINRIEQVTLAGGKTHRHDPAGQPVDTQNMSLSAVIVVERYPIGQKRFLLAVHEKEREIGRDLTVEEFFQMTEESAGTERDLGLNRVRVRVHENPYARIPLSRSLFNGSFDERYGDIAGNGRYGRVYAGRGVSDFESQSNDAKLLSRL